MDLNLAWDYVADDVMGGVSTGGMQQDMYRGRFATVLRGDVSLDNNGGFVQIASDICRAGAAFDASSWDGIAFDACGNGAQYDVRLRTDQLTRPWQSFRSDFIAGADWNVHRIAFDALEAHKTDATFDAAQLRRIGILAIGRAFQAEVAVANVRLYRLA